MVLPFWCRLTGVVLEKRPLNGSSTCGFDWIAGWFVQMTFARNVSQWSAMKPALYHGHLAYIDFARFVFT